MTNLTLNTPSKPLLLRLTVADGLLLIVAFLAGLMRFIGLGRLPLSPTEAGEALAVWAFWQPNVSAATVGSPAYFSFTSLLLPLLGDSDAVMRLVPALFGWGLVLLPWLLRRRLGTVGALLTSLLLAASPLTAVSARNVSGDAIALFAAALLLVALTRWEDDADQRWLRWLGIALGLGLASSPLFYTLALTLVAATAVQRWLFARTDPENTVPTPALPWRDIALPTVLTLLTTATLFLWHPAGLGAAAAIPAAWLAQFSPFLTTSIIEPFLAVARYEPLLLVVGITAVLYTAWHTELRWANRLVYWIAALTLVMVLQNGVIGNGLALALPGYLLLGAFIHTIVRERITLITAVTTGGIFFAGMAIFVNIARFVRNTAELLPLWTAVFVLAFTLVSLLYLAGYAPRSVGKGVLLGTIGVFLFYGWGTSWWLSQTAANDLRERWVTSATDDDVRLLVGTLADISRQISGSEYDAAITSAVDTPLLRWYLRDFRQVTYTAGVPAAAQDVIIAPENAELALTSDYRGMDFGLLRTCPNPIVTTTNNAMLDTLRWWLFQESPACGTTDRVIVWLRGDLITPP